MRRLGVGLLCVLLCFSLLAGCSATSHDGESKTPSGSSILAGRNVEDVARLFETRGFTNIQTVMLEDLITGWLTKDGEVEEVSVGGDTEYSADRWVPADTEVVISYHTFASRETTSVEDSEAADVPLPPTPSPDPEPEEIVSPAPEPADALVAEDISNTPVPETPTQDSTLTVHFIDVGQADAALVACDGEAMMIDGGNAADSSLIYTYLRNNAIDHLKYIVCTHAHEDHVGGLSGALNYATVDTAFCSATSYDTRAFESFVKYLGEQGKTITIPSAGDTFSLGSATVEVLGPIRGSENVNNESIVLRIVHGEISFLFTGDAEREEEQDILEAGYDLQSTVLKVGYHGSDSSTTYPFLREIMPQYAVISVGEGNAYGHPTENTLSRLRDADVRVFRTDMQGDDICVSDGQTVSFTVERNADADTLSPVGPNSQQRAAEQQEATDEPTEDGSNPGTTYVLNTNTHKFHYPSCSSVDQMKEKNKQVYTGTREEVISMGYDPCGRCHP